MYAIDLATILQLLREFRRSGILQAELPAGLPRFKQLCQVVIELSQGEVTSCFVKNASGQTLLSNYEALQELSLLEKVNWEFNESPERPATSPGQAPAPPPPQAFRPPPRQTPTFPRSPVPHRLFYVSAADASNWPLLHRQTFVLVDGKRSIEQIAAILSQPVHTVDGILQDLRSIGVVAL